MKTTCGFDRRRSKRAAFTLIELLIVIAIISIMAGATMAYLTAPAEEQVFAIEEQAYESGGGVFFSQLVADAHDSASLAATGDATSGPQTLVFRPGAKDAPAIVYFVDKDGHLRRAKAVEGAGAADRMEAMDAMDVAASAVLMDGVERLSAQFDKATSLWRVSLRAGFERYDRKTGIERQVDVAVGPAWLGGGS